MKLAFILGDQLSPQLASLSKLDPSTDQILMAEVRAEATAVRHHKKKIAFIFSAMRHFAEELKKQGFTVHYTRINDPDNAGSFRAEAERAISEIQPESLIITAPSEYRVFEEVKSWQDEFSTSVEILPDDRFLATPEDFAQWAAGRKQFRMEFFYREMRRRYDVLMNGEDPEGGKWNFDHDNRKTPPKGTIIPEASRFAPDPITIEAINDVAHEFSEHFGDLQPFHYAVTRHDALTVLKQFIEERLPSFGDYQDAMLQDEPWMYHSHIGHYLNCGLLHPLECIKNAEAAYHEGSAPLNAVEGFIRQILGWREYVRGIYWLKMPNYEKANFFEADRALPPLYWGALTRMNCLGQCVRETRENAYAHHIQRLMVLGNFALLAGIDPREVNDWFHVVYADAYQWVELPNVSGMSLFADGGLLASKPYSSSGAYINKMSNYCRACSYSVSTKAGPKACPFNYLYWNFLQRNRLRLKGNQRLAMTYRTLDKMTPERQTEIETDAARFLGDLDKGELV
ncbi:MAG: (6-4) photolyase [Opitutia bacterium UBA7350]|nr:MAG: (6-4) photolyase [Opitutae bacterium UBA7350]